jgi:hypothetical protein
MTQTVQRLRYFDGEYLRRNDFTDEQSYHVSMRRQLNRALHLSGIVTGLEIQQDADSVPPDALFFSVSPGFAIDQVGREIVVAAPYALSSDNVLNRAGLQAGDNELWIVYTETATGLPAPGYQLCDQPNQNTRWTESFDVVLKPKGAAPSKTGKDPNADLKGVRLGTVTLKNDPLNGWGITAFDDLGRTYAGIRAQSIIAPDQVDTDPFRLTAQNVTPPAAGHKAQAPVGYLDVGPSIFARGNMFVEQNAVIGDDFELANTNPPAPAPTPTHPNGNVKLNSDLFLNGKIYIPQGGNWVPLSDYVTATPDVQFKTVHIDTSAGSGTVSPQVQVSTTLPSFTQVDVQASIAAIAFVQQSDMETFLTHSGFPGSPQATVSASFAGRTPPKTALITVDWSVGAGWEDASNNFHYLVASIDVALTVVFRP